jgi:cytoskeletal protein CcmA (bactofilin family)
MFKKGEGDEGHDPAIVSTESGEGRGSEVTVVGQGARLEGTVVSAGSLRIDGQVKGKVTAEGDVLLSANSLVEAEIQAQNVTVAGRFKGNIVVTGKAELARGGRVDGNITSKSLVVAEGAIFTGQSIMDQQAASAGRTMTSDGAATVSSAGDVSVTSTQGSAEPAKIRR